MNAPEQSCAALATYVKALFEQLTGPQFHGLREPFDSRDPRVPFAGLDAADLGRMHPTPFSHLLLAQLQFETGLPQVWPKLAHEGDR